MSRNDAMIDAVRHHYNTSIFDYEDRRLNEEGPVEYAMTLRYLDHWIAAGSVVADIGVGVGHYARHLAQRQCQIHLVDIAERLLNAATAQLTAAGLEPQIIGVTLASATDLRELADNTFDAVLMLGPLYHLCTLEDRHRAVREAQRMLKPGGVLFAAGINRVAYLKERLRLKPEGVSALGDFHRGYLEHGNLDPDHAPPMGFAHLTTVAEFRALFHDAFDEVLLAGVESFTGHHQKHLHDLPEADRQAWLELVAATAATAEGLGSTEHFLFVGRKKP
jgi:S-adenosylmethionine-dependent methyltransferase